MQLTLNIPKPPVIQIALDYATIDEALAMAKIGVEAGVDWLEIGTPLIVSQGVAPIGKMVRAFPDFPVLADYKTMDSGWKNVQRTAEQGGHVMTVCANAPGRNRAKSAIAESKNSGVWVVVDTIGVKNQAARAKQCADWGAHMIYLHYGADQRKARRHSRLDPMARRGAGRPSRFPSAWAAFWSKTACGRPRQGPS